jgi:hypothetical protein
MKRKQPEENITKETIDNNDINDNVLHINEFGTNNLSFQSSHDGVEIRHYGKKKNCVYNVSTPIINNNHLFKKKVDSFVQNSTTSLSSRKCILLDLDLDSNTSGQVSNSQALQKMAYLKDSKSTPGKTNPPRPTWRRVRHNDPTPKRTRISSISEQNTSTNGDTSYSTKSSNSKNYSTSNEEEISSASSSDEEETRSYSSKDFKIPIIRKLIDILPRIEHKESGHSCSLNWDIQISPNDNNNGKGIKCVICPRRGLCSRQCCDLQLCAAGCWKKYCEFRKWDYRLSRCANEECDRLGIKLEDRALIDEHNIEDFLPGFSDDYNYCHVKFETKRKNQPYNATTLGPNNNNNNDDDGDDDDDNNDDDDDDDNDNEKINNDEENSEKMSIDDNLKDFIEEDEAQTVPPRAKKYSISTRRMHNNSLQLTTFFNGESKKKISVNNQKPTPKEDDPRSGSDDPSEARTSWRSHDHPGRARMTCGRSPHHGKHKDESNDFSCSEFVNHLLGVGKLTCKNKRNAYQRAIVEIPSECECRQTILLAVGLYSKTKWIYLKVKQQMLIFEKWNELHKMYSSRQHHAIIDNPVINVRAEEEREQEEDTDKLAGFSGLCKYYDIDDDDRRKNASYNNTALYSNDDNDDDNERSGDDEKDLEEMNIDGNLKGFIEEDEAQSAEKYSISPRKTHNSSIQLRTFFDAETEKSESSVNDEESTSEEEDDGGKYRNESNDDDDSDNPNSDSLNEEEKNDDFLNDESDRGEATTSELRSDCFLNDEENLSTIVDVEKPKQREKYRKLPTPPASPDISLLD